MRTPGGDSAEMVVNFGTSLTLANVGEMKQRLLDALGSREPLSLDATTLDEIDVAGLQLLCATHRHAAARGTKVRFVGGARPDMAATARAAGFAPGRGCAADCLCAEVGRG
jgi:anti-anti-sigma regulatory factor